MITMHRWTIATILSAGLLSLPACAVVSENVSRDPLRGGYPGYAVEYVDAMPSPGKGLAAGTSVRFEIKVRYLLQRAEKGTLELTFEDDSQRRLQPSGGDVTLEIQRCRWTPATLSKTVEIPGGTSELYLVIPLTPEGDRDPRGALRLRYPVVRSQ